MVRIFCPCPLIYSKRGFDHTRQNRFAYLIAGSTVFERDILCLRYLLQNAWAFEVTVCQEAEKEMQDQHFHQWVSEVSTAAANNGVVAWLVASGHGSQRGNEIYLKPSEDASMGSCIQLSKWWVFLHGKLPPTSLLIVFADMCLVGPGQGWKNLTLPKRGVEHFFMFSGQMGRPSYHNSNFSWFTEEFVEQGWNAQAGKDINDFFADVAKQVYITARENNRVQQPKKRSSLGKLKLVLKTCAI
mmetsp:Transcript_6171/g.12490  ORF Transcript_6171/g.12490 Transcript_6171/m.12490 type:complete len:243 (+) Transcript_6171:54-782(+)